MSDKKTIRKTLYRFNQESNVLLRSSYDDLPLPFQRFIERIESEAVIKDYLDDCVENHTPDGFDARDEVNAAANDYGVIFGPFSTIPEEESAQVYLILKELVAQEVKGRSTVFYGYAPKNFADMYKGFLDKVARRLIGNIECHLALIGIDMGLDEDPLIANTFNGPVHNAQLNQPTGGSAVNATQDNGINYGELESLLNAVLDHVDNCDDETIRDISENLDIVREQMTSGEPKRGVLKSAIGFLKGIDAGTQFTAAVTQIVEFVALSGVQLTF